MIRARAKALQEKMTSFLSMCEFDVLLDGILRHASTLCILRYQPQCNSTTDLGANTGRGPREEGSLAAPGQVLLVGRPVLPPLKHPDGATAPLPASIRTGTTGPLPVNPFPLAVIPWRLSGTTPEVDRYYRRPDDRYYRPHHRYYRPTSRRNDKFASHKCKYIIT
jgi:hypothetical protein